MADNIIKGIFQQDNVCPPTVRTLDLCFLPSLYSQKPWMNIERKWRPHEKTLMTLNAIMNSAHHLRCKHTAGFLNVCQYTKISNRKSFSMEWKNLMQKLNLFLLHFLTTALGLISSYLFWYKHHCLQRKKKKKKRALKYTHISILHQRRLILSTDYFYHKH